MPTNDGASQERKASKSSVVRPEARPLYWKDLTEDQQRVVVQLHQWIDDYVHSPLDKGVRTGGNRSPFDYQEIHEHRTSNVILIDGGRGSGKTSVLVTALRLWRRSAAGDVHQLYTDLFGPPAADGSPPAMTGEELNPRQEIIARLQTPLARKLIPIRPLDLQPLPPSTSLLPWLAGRILELVDHLEDPSGGRTVRENTASIASWEPDWEKELTSRRHWRNLLQSAALGWASNLPARQGSLDPDSYAEELKQAERARLTMVDQWRNFLDAVVADAHRLYPHLVDDDARLIIPIDDADMNPHRCVDLLELMRSLWSPRVFFILTGHSPLFQKTLHLHYLRLMRQPLGPGSLTQQEFEYVEAKPNARQLGLQSYDKVIPAGHRFKLAKLSGSERFALLSEVLDASILKEKEDAPIAPSTLAGYFELTPSLQEGLPHRLRQIQNILQTLKRDHHATERVRRLWLDTIDNGDWTTEEQARLKQVIQVNADGDLRVEVDQKLQPVTRRLKRLTPSEKLSLNINIVTGFTFKGPLVDDRRSRGEEVSFREFPDYLTQLLILAMNVAADTSNGSFPRTAPAPRHYDYPLVVSHLHPIGRLPSQIAFTWPIPEWAAPIDFTLFNKVWADHLLSLLNEPKVPDLAWYSEMVQLYLSGIVEIGTTRVLTNPAPSNAQEVPREPSSWSPLVQRIVNEAARLHGLNYRTNRMGSFYSWLMGEAILIAAPEYGLPEELANNLLAQWLAALARHDKAFRAQALKTVRTARRLKVEFAIRSIRSRGFGVEEFLTELDTTFDRYHWGREVAGRVEIASGLPREVEELLQKVVVQHPPASSAKVPSTLHEYLQKLEVTPFLSMADPQQRRDLRKALERYAHIRGAAPRVLRQLWLFFVVHPAPDDLQHQLNARLTLEKGDHLTLQLPGYMSQWLAEPAAQRATPGRDIEVHGEAATKLPCSLRILSLGRWLDRAEDSHKGLLQVAHDVQFDEDDGREPGEEHPPGPAHKAVLPRVTTLVRVGVEPLEFDWLVPAWDTFLDWKETDHIWQTVFARVSSLLSETGNSLSEAALVALLHSFLDAMSRLWLGRGVEVQSPNLKMGPEEFASLGRRIQEALTHSPHLRGARLFRAVQWAREAAALYAAPESGMPVWAAEAYLSAWEGSSRQTVKTVRDLRRRRAKSALERVERSTPFGSAPELLFIIDQETGDHHPWFKIFGRDVDRMPVRASPKRK